MSLFRVTHSLSVATGVETAQFTLFIIGSSSANAAVVGNIGSSAWSIAWGSIRSAFSPSVAPTRYRCDQVDPTTGHTISGVDFTVPTTAGSATSGQLPSQCAVVVTKRSALSGPRFRGRMYLPPVCQGACDANGKLIAATQTQLLNALAIYVRAYAFADPTLTPAIFSRAAGGSTAITSIEIGTVIDTQRSRRGRLVESRVSASIP